MGLSSEALADPLDGGVVDPERRLQHLVLDRRHGLEQRRRHGLRVRVLAVERRKRNGGPVAHVELEVHQAAREHEQLALLDGGGEQRVGGAVGAHEAHVQLALEHQEELRRARVRVRGVEPALGEVDARGAQPLRVEPGELPHEGGRDGGLVGVVGVAGVDERRGHEVRGHDLARGLAGEAVDDDVAVEHGDAEVLERVGVRRHGQHGHERHGDQHSEHRPRAAALHDAHSTEWLCVTVPRAAGEGCLWTSDECQACGNGSAGERR